MTKELLCQLELDDENRFRFIVYDQDNETISPDGEVFKFINDIYVFEQEKDLRKFIDENYFINGELQIGCDFLKCEMRT